MAGNYPPPSKNKKINVVKRIGSDNNGYWVILSNEPDMNLI